MKSVIFNTEMVKAILDGRKTQFRKVINNCKNYKYENRLDLTPSCYYAHFRTENFIPTHRKSKYSLGDILYVKETFQVCKCGFCEACNTYDFGLIFKADYDDFGNHKVLYTCCEDEMYWKSSNNMPKEYARIFLKITNVRVERLQDITWQDIFKEGFEAKEQFKIPKSWFVNICSSTAKDGYKWKDNPYVFVYEFERVVGV